MSLNLETVKSKLDSESAARWLPRGRLRWIAVAAVLLLVVGAVVAAVAHGREDERLPRGVALRIHGKDVTEKVLAGRIATLQALYGVTPPAEGDPAAASFRRDSAKSFVVGEVVAQEVRRRGIVVPTKKARAELAKIVDQRLAGDAAAFARFLGEQGITEKDVLGEITRTMATDELHTQVVADVPDATLEDARAEFEARRDAMRAPERRSLRNIVVASREDAEAVLAELTRGVSFAKVAAVSSLDASTKAKGGALGTRTSTELDPSYASAAFAAKRGAPFGPVKSEFGWNVGVVTRIEPGELLSFAQVKATLLAALTTKAQDEAWQRFLKGLLKDADVTYAAKYRPADPDGLPSTAPPSPAED